MDSNDPTTVECLRILLADQSRDLRNLAWRIESLCVAGERAVHPAHWSGMARNAHDALVEHFVAHLRAARLALSAAADDSAHAVSSLAGHVG